MAGLVLLDPGHEDIMSYLPAFMTEINEHMQEAEQLPDLSAEQLDASRTALTSLYASWPADVRDTLVDYHLVDWRIGVRETENFETEVYDELRSGGPLPDVPTIVLTATGQNPYWRQFMTPDQLAEAHAGLQSMHAALAVSVPDGEHRLVAGASHQYVHIDGPDAVVTAILDVLARARSQTGPGRP